MSGIKARALGSYPIAEVRVRCRPYPGGTRSREARPGARTKCVEGKVDLESDEHD